LARLWPHRHGHGLRTRDGAGRFARSWRGIERMLDAPTEDGEMTIRLWTTLPTQVSAAQVAALYRRRWRIAGMFQHLESVLPSAIGSRGHPRAALLGFAGALLAYTVLASSGRCVERAHHHPPQPPPAGSLFPLALTIQSSDEGMLIAWPSTHWTVWRQAHPCTLAERRREGARHINPKRVATSTRNPKPIQRRGYLDGKTARSHIATAPVLAQDRI
jgi:hypothetical protein